MASRVTNKELSSQISYIKGKIEAGERFAKEHRNWEVTSLQRIENSLDAQNGRLRKTESTLGWFKGMMATITVITGWMAKKIMGG